jgi:hypothetical protein
MKRTGSTDMSLHGGKVPPWLYQRMTRLGRAIAEMIIDEYGTDEFLRRLSNPFWFQSLGSVLGMDWHSSGITASVMGALKRGINPVATDLGIYICGGRGKHSRQTPEELFKYADKTGIDGEKLVQNSRMSAKVDNTAIQDGFQLYLHSFVVSEEGKWAVIQQGMNQNNRMARRYHWHSTSLRSFVEEPHTSVCGINQGTLLNLTDKKARSARNGIVKITGEKPWKMMQEVQKLTMPAHHAVYASDINLKRLGAVLTLAYELGIDNFESLMLLKGLGPKTLRSLSLVSEIIHGTPTRFSDPARFSFAHGGKDGQPFPVQTHVYDQTINELNEALKRAKIQQTDKKQAFKQLHQINKRIELNFKESPGKYSSYLTKERQESCEYGGMTAGSRVSKPKKVKKVNYPKQLKLF